MSALFSWRCELDHRLDGDPVQSVTEGEEALSYSRAFETLFLHDRLAVRICCRHRVSQGDSVAFWLIRLEHIPLD